MATAYASDTDYLSPEHVYPLDNFYRRSGISRSRVREARLAGIELTKLSVGKRAYVRGSDAIAFIERLAELSAAE